MDWSDDGQLYVAQAAATGWQIFKLNPFSGSRAPVRDLHFGTVSGMILRPPTISRNGKTLGYRYGLSFQDLFVISGAK
ncbi:MAG TPA: hypothetical protein VFU76_18705 [Terriglobales bacterium]|nr:hypothetical protein [Terriglobales bacterium]